VEGGCVVAVAECSCEDELHYEEGCEHATNDDDNVET